ncbi:MAG: hypothetical protein JSR84_04600 [Proteobacteria bacterium]|nr:hypothetical protein [Pseudomonadota bacterium]
MNLQLLRCARLAVCVVALAALGGCAFGQKVGYSGVKADIEAQGTSTVSVATHDQRPYVVSGNKKPTFVGLSRGGFGNPFDVNTVSGAPLADDFSNSISTSLAARGFKTSVVHLAADESPRAVKEALKTPADRVVLVTLHEWKSDTFVHTKLIWNVTVAVYVHDGHELASVPFQGEEPIGGTVQAAFTRKLEEWFSDAKIVAALK